MQTYETPYVADWFAISLRWTVMIGFVVSLALGGELTLALFWPIAVMIFWNMGMTVLASLNIRLNFHRHVSLAADFLLSGVFFWVRLRPFQQGMALLEIEDDGVGFDTEAVNKAYDKRSSLGMVNLRERTELVNGLLNLQSTPGKGTNVSVYIPLTDEAADRLHHPKPR